MDKYDIIVLAGQSNASGTGAGEVTREYIPNEKILFFTDFATPSFVRVDGVITLKMENQQKNQVVVADEPIGKNGKTGNLSLTFAERYVKDFLAPDRKLLIVNAGVGGAGFARPEWGVGNILHTRMMNMVQEALALNPENRIVAFLWHQGEHDSFENADWDLEKRYRVHKKNLTDTLNDFYAVTGDPAKIPFIAAGFCDEWYLQNKAPCDAVLQAIQECCAEYGGGFVETSGLASNNQKIGNGDGIHFCRESLHILGEKYYDEYIKLRKN